MAKRSDTFKTVLMALELLRRIPRKRKVSAPELREQLREFGMERDLPGRHRQRLEALALAATAQATPGVGGIECAENGADQV